MKIKILIILLLVAVTPVGIRAEEHTQTLSSLQAQIQALLSQVQELQKQLTQSRQEIIDVREEFKTTVAELRLQLQEGHRGAEVLTLQEILATDKTLYPEGLITGFYGPLTRRAVIKFQEKYGIDAVGEVGPQTRKALNAFLTEGKRKSDTEKISKTLLRDLDIGDDNNSDIDSLTHNEKKKALGKTKVRVCHNGKSLVIASPAVNAHVSHGDTVGACGKDDVPSPDKTSPEISEIISKDVGTTTASIMWLTNENATSRVVYSSTTPTTSNGTYATDPELVKNHLIHLSGLVASTTYYYVVFSADAVGNSATSSENYFTTR